MDISNTDTQHTFILKEGWPKKAKPYLDTLAMHGAVMSALRQARWYHQALMKLRSEDPDFVECEKLATMESDQSLVQEAVRRARDGWLEPVFWQGEECGQKLKFSDTLLLAELKKRFPEYRDRIEHSGEVGLKGSVTLYMPDNGRGTPDDNGG